MEFLEHVRLAIKGTKSAMNPGRCIKSSRVCLGYKDSDSLLFRYYDGKRGNGSSNPPLMESSQAIIQTLSSTPEITISGPNDAHIEQHALAAFFDDYCVKSADRSLSRGFLDGLKPLIVYAGQYSDIAQAAKMVALAGIGNRMGTPILYTKPTHTAESLMTGVLLGLYEIITSIETAPGQHVAHVRGVSAILSRPLKQPQVPGVLCAPTSNSSIQNLDAILIQFNPLFYRASTLLSDASTALEDIQHLRQDAMVLDNKFSRWSASQGSPGRLAPLAKIKPGHRNSQIAGQEMLTLILTKEAQKLAEGIVASIPYHLTKDPQTYIHETQTGSEEIIPGSPVGGLLLMHPLFVAARMPVVSPQLRAYMSRCLAWIGKNMGIGQSTLLSNASALKAGGLSRDVLREYLVYGYSSV
ncbi:MAG: hypothetical protein M1834_003096 [Cirrosporium novae-zelandiae]|nr:MAG: hypothetical protein M1834_003096 [Cirrosporium novae-zelandiae]